MATLKFTSPPGQDLSTRTDFTYDLMSRLAKGSEEFLQGIPEVAELKGRADVHIAARNTLQTIDIDVDVRPRVGVELTEEEVSKVKAAIQEAIQQEMQGNFSKVIQESITAARQRMGQ